MTTAERVKLQAAGTSLFMLVESAELVPVGKFPEYSFVGQIDNGRVVDLRVPKASADRQLGRLNLVLADTVGLRLLFSRGENPSDAAKPFWNIDVVSDSGARRQAGNGQASAQSGAAGSTTQPLPPAQPPATTTETGHALYEKITAYVLKTIVPQYRQAGLAMTPEAITSCVHTLYIQASRR